MKILHVVQCYYPALGGSEMLARQLSERLVAQHGDEVTVFTSANLNAESFWRGSGPTLAPGIETIHGVRVRRFAVYNGLQFVREMLARGSRRLRLPFNDRLRTWQTGPLAPEMRRAIAESDAEIVLATAFPFMHMYYALEGARRGGKPIVFLGAIHTEDKWGYERGMMYDAIRRADAYIAHTEHEREHLRARGVDGEKIRIVGGGYDERLFAQADGAGVRARYGWGDDPLVVAMHRQSALKRLELAIQAMPAVWARFPRARLLLAGARTSHTPHLEALVAKLPAEQRERVTFVHNFGEEEKPDLLAAADVFVHPSVNESFGIVLVEAWACGKPVIGANQGAVASVIDAGRDGLLFDPMREPGEHGSLAAQIVALLGDPALRTRLGEAGRRKARARYTWDGVTRQVREVYVETLARRARRVVSGGRVLTQSTQRHPEGSRK